jgi:preprotein translocase subunit SecA
VFSWLGLSVAAVTTEDRRFGDVAVRREKFGADITYVTGQVLAFTWMFDNTSSCRKPDQQVPLTLTLIYTLVVGQSGLATGSGGRTQSNMHNESCPPNQ